MIRKLLTLVLLLQCLVPFALAQTTTPLKNLEEATTVNAFDIFYMVGSPSGANLNRKITAASIALALTGNRIMGSFADLAEAQSTIGTSTRATILIASTTTVSANLTITSNIELMPTGAGLISINSGQTLTIQSSGRRWPVKQIFTGNGSVAFGPLVTEKYCEWFGALANSGDDSAAINKTIAAGGGAIILQSEPAVYGVSDALTGTVSNVTFTCPKGGAVIKALTADKILDQSFGTYSGWKFQNIELYGECFLYDTRGIEFDNCKFRHASSYSVQIAGGQKVKFQNCSFYGTRSGVMAAGDDDPAAVSGATYGYGVRLQQGASDVEFIDCYFGFCVNGIGADTITGTNAMRGLKIRGGTFRGDWWNSPFVVARITPTAYNTGTRALTASGGFNAAFTGQPLRVISVPIEISTGSSFNLLLAGLVGVASGTPFANAQRGDVIETADGRRAEVVSKISSTQVSVLGWEDVSTFEPIAPPAGATAFRLTRFYAAGLSSLTSDTEIVLYNDPVCPYTGERLVADAGLSPVGKPCRIFATLNYSGLHLNGGVFDFSVMGATFRGSRSDHVSVFNCEAPRIIGNHISLFFDGGVTITASPGAVISNNIFDMCGVAAVWLGSNHASITGNTVNNWGLIDKSGIAAFDGGGIGQVIANNTVNPASGGPGSGAAYGVRFAFASDCTNSRIEGNTGFENARIASLYVDASAGPLTADVDSIEGPGRDLVRLGINEPWTLKTGLVEHFKLEDNIGSHYGLVLTNNNTVTFGAGKVGNAATFGGTKYLSITDNPLVSIGLGIDFQFTCWVKLTSLTAGYIFGKNSGGASADEYHLEYNSGANRFIWNVSNGTTVTAAGANSFGAPSTGTWYFIRCGWDRVSGVAFIQVNNGTIDTVVHANGARNGTDPLGIGARGDGFSPIDGMIDEFSFWKHRKLNADDLTKLYGGGSGLAWPLL